MSDTTLPFPVVLSELDVATFHAKGFVTIPEISFPEEVASLRQTFERLFEQQAGRAEGAQFDMVGYDEEHTAPKLPQILKPSDFAPELRCAQFRKNGLAVARQLLGPSVRETAEHAILKPAGYGAATPWHQDEASRSSDIFAYEQLSIWMPLQQATPENGCLQYIPESHHGDVLEHRSPHDDPRIHALECAGKFDPASAVLCPLPPGGAAIHHGRTLHYAGPNHSDTARYAYVLMYETPPKPTSAPRNFSWNHSKRTARLDRRAQWRRRGGALVMLQRKLRSDLWRSPRHVTFELRRLFHEVSKRLWPG